jgi:hypothetical protein
MGPLQPWSWSWSWGGGRVVVTAARLLVETIRKVVVVVARVVVVVEGAVEGADVDGAVVVTVVGTVGGAVATGTKSKVAGVDSARSQAASSSVAATTEKMPMRALNARLGAMDRHPIEREHPPEPRDTTSWSSLT